MTIHRIEISNHTLPLEPPFPAAWDPRPRTRFTATIVRIHDDSGVVGLGSGTALHDLSEYSSLLIGHDPLDLERHHEIIANASFHGGRLWPAEVALWDLAGKLSGLPVWQMAGGRSDRVDLYASTGTLRSAHEMARQAAALERAGFTAVKLRLGRSSIEDDLEVVEAVVDTCQPTTRVLVDCNQGWRMPWDTTPAWTLDVASSVARRLSALGVFWMEEPLHRGDVQGMQRLRAEAGLLIAGGEMTRELHEFDRLLDGRCLDVYQPDVTLTGGMAGLRALAARVEALGLVFTPHTWGDGLAVMANLHLAAGAASPPFVEYPIDPPEWTIERRDFVLSRPIVASADGSVTLSGAPGLGVDLDEERLAATASGTTTVLT